ncbi:MAG: ABC transporter permease, partial [Boseongicola sp.]|nr:ABC transporter permease [Boseongicola sp.]
MFAAVSDLSRNERTRTMMRVFREPLGAFGIALVLLMVGGAVFADLLTSFDPSRISPRDRFQSPSLDHLLGTDHLGRDLFSRVLHGGRIALSVALFATATSLAIGVVLGLVAGYGPRWLDAVMLLLAVVA